MEILLAQPYTLFDLTQVYPMLRGEIPIREPQHQGGFRLKNTIPIAKLLLERDREHYAAALPGVEFSMLCISDGNELLLQFFHGTILKNRYVQPLATIALETLPAGIYENLHYVLQRLAERQVKPIEIGRAASEIGMMILQDRSAMDEFARHQNHSLDTLVQELIRVSKADPDPVQDDSGDPERPKFLS